MKWVKRILAVVLLVIAAFFIWNWFFGPLKAKRQYAQFAKAMASCTPLEQTVTAMLRGLTLTRSVKGPDGDTCGVELQTPAPFPQFLVCDLPLDQMPELAASFLKQNDNIGPFGITRVYIDIASDDPWQVAMNSAACRIEER
ncbi:MAG TPA: hypothetical protein ENJ52_03025 [Aliiroseovarius sp.]|nr:hypothetical protein [Aliiroseovarius sp.]